VRLHSDSHGAIRTADRMLRKACGSFVLMRAGELPGDLEVEKAYSLEGVFGWYRDCPEQIERAVLSRSSLRRPRER
jgi:hypothetical protein